MQEFTEKDVCRQKRRHLSRTGWWFFPQRYYQSITQGSFFSVRISRKQKIPDTPLPIWFPYLLGRHGTAGTGMWLVCCGQNCWGKRNDSSSPRSVHLGRWIYMDIPLNILDTVFCRMELCVRGMAGKSRGSMELCNDAEGLPVSDFDLRQG